MQAIHLALFDALRADHAFTSVLLWMARYGAALAAMVVGWVVLRRPQERMHGVAIVLTAVLASGVAHALADSLNVARPYMAGMGPPRIPHGARGGLPSAHATVMFTVALLLWLRPALRLAALTVTVLAVLTCLGRIHAHVHFPIDIAAGLLLAVLIATAAHLGLRRLGQLRRPTLAQEGVIPLDAETARPAV